MLGDFASLDVQNTYRGSDAYVLIFNKIIQLKKQTRSFVWAVIITIQLFL
ncbi:hypothetical protein [Piscirickettsia salmonis]|nr:hypothetical protein [Piscirickettsia salmonis]